MVSFQVFCLRANNDFEVACWALRMPEGYEEFREDLRRAGMAPSRVDLEIVENVLKYARHASGEAALRHGIFSPMGEILCDLIKEAESIRRLSEEE